MLLTLIITVNILHYYIKMMVSINLNFLFKWRKHTRNLRSGGNPAGASDTMVHKNGS